MGTPSLMGMLLPSDNGTRLTSLCPSEGRRAPSSPTPRRPSSTRRGPRRPRRSTRRDRRTPRLTGTDRPVHGRSCPGRHLLSPRPVRQGRRIHPRGQGAGVLPEEDQGQEGKINTRTLTPPLAYVVIVISRTITRL